MNALVDGVSYTLTITLDMSRFLSGITYVVLFIAGRAIKVLKRSIPSFISIFDSPERSVKEKLPSPSLVAVIESVV